MQRAAALQAPSGLTSAAAPAPESRLCGEAPPTAPARCHGDPALANHAPARQVLPSPPLRTTFPVRLSKRERARPPPADAHCQRPLTTEKSSVPLREMRRVADCGGPLPALAAALPLRPRPGLTNCRDGRYDRLLRVRTVAPAPIGKRGGGGRSVASRPS